MATPSTTLIIIGGGIVGLTMAVAAQARGYIVTVIARDDLADSASGVAAGMIAPALEALHDRQPELSYQRLKAAQSAWFDLFDLWPPSIQHALRTCPDSLYVWPTGDRSDAESRLTAMGVGFAPLRPDELSRLADGLSGVRVMGEHLVDARRVLVALTERVSLRVGVVRAVSANSVQLDSGEVLTAEAVVIASGYGSHAFADSVPCLAHLTPIKGHILDLPGWGDVAVTRSAAGYFADYGAMAKFGATMQVGRYDLRPEPDQVQGLKHRAAGMLPLLETGTAVARVGVRAASPDGWPLIGRDATSGVWIATAMRRNGYVFAPFAARMILDLMAGGAPSDADIYDPNRF